MVREKEPVRLGREKTLSVLTHAPPAIAERYGSRGAVVAVGATLPEEVALMYESLPVPSPRYDREWSPLSMGLSVARLCVCDPSEVRTDRATEDEARVPSREPPR